MSPSRLEVLTPASGFGALIRAARQAGEQSLSEFATTLGVARQTVSNWEVGRALPRPQLLQPIADITGTTIEELIRVGFPVQVIRVHIGMYRWFCVVCKLEGPVLTSEDAKQIARAEGIRHSKKHDQ